MAVRFVADVFALLVFVLTVVALPTVFTLPVGFAVPVGFAAPVVLLTLRELAVVAFAAFALAFGGLVPSSADLASRAASLAGAGRGFGLVFTGCHVCGERIALCLRNSRAASS